MLGLQFLIACALFPRPSASHGIRRLHSAGRDAISRTWTVGVVVSSRRAGLQVNCICSIVELNAGIGRHGQVSRFAHEGSAGAG